MQLPETLSETKLWTLGLGALGAVMSLSSIKGMSWRQKLAMGISGAVIAALFAQPIIDLVNMPPGWSGGIAYLVGMFGWAVVDKTISTIREADLWSLVSDIVRSWLARRGG
ncbi:hypothetical protein [Paralcaligenes ginsengisoli]